MVIQTHENTLLHTPLPSHTFMNLFIEEHLLSDRNGVLVISIGTLLQTLITAIDAPHAAPVEDIFARILRQPTAHAAWKISVNRVPSFAPGDMMNGAHGYRYLGTLGSISIGNTSPQIYFDSGRDVLAAYMAGSNPASELFLQVWQPTGLQLTHHFIVMFADPSPAYSRHSSPSIASDVMSSSRHASPLTPWSEIARNTTPPHYGNIPHSQNFQIPGAVSTVTNEPAAHPADHPLSTAPAGLPLLDVYATAGISPEEIDAALFRDKVPTSRPESLLIMVQNHHAMSHLLVRLGLPGFRENPAGDQCKVYPGGLKVESALVLDDRKWSHHSYMHKSNFFSFGEKAAARQWQGPVRAYLFC